jgi:hypothetical protein
LIFALFLTFKLAPLNRRAQNVIIEAVIIAELKFSNIERHILAADLVERADDTALEDAPKALNRLGGAVS